MRIAYFGGTFDPPHCGHLMIAMTILEKKLAEKVMLAPAKSPPHKLNCNITPFYERFRMLELATEGIKNVEVTDFEQSISGPSYTYIALNVLKKLDSFNEYIPVIGGDSLRSLHTWYHAKELVRDYNFICFNRPGEEISIAELETNWDAATAKRMVGWIVADTPLTDISSSEIRFKIASGKKAEGISAKVLTYIHERKLYQNE